MAHREQLYFVQGVRDILFDTPSDIDIFEVGSYDVNGTIRKIFNDCKSYKGADLATGPGVDIVGSGHEIRLPDNSFDLSLSCECFEHNPYWIETFQNMHRMTKSDGYVVITCGSRGRVEHGTSRTTVSDSPGTSAVGIDYYRNLGESDFVLNLPLTKMFSDYKFWYINASSDLYFIGRKCGNTTTSNISRNFSSLIHEIKTLSARHRGIPRQLLFRIYRLPLDIAAIILDEKRFQNFAVAYDRLCTPFKAKRHL